MKYKVKVRNSSVTKHRAHVNCFIIDVLHTYKMIISCCPIFANGKPRPLFLSPKTGLIPCNQNHIWYTTIRVSQKTFAKITKTLPLTF